MNERVRGPMDGAYVRLGQNSGCIAKCSAMRQGWGVRVETLVVWKLLEWEQDMPLSGRPFTEYIYMYICIWGIFYVREGKVVLRRIAGVLGQKTAD